MQPDVVHDARQRRVVRCWEARLAPRPLADRLPVQPSTRSNRQQVLDPSTLPGREPVGVAVQLHAPEVRLDLQLEHVAGDGSLEVGEGVAGSVRFVESRNHLVRRRHALEVWAVDERSWVDREDRRCWAGGGGRWWWWWLWAVDDQGGEAGASIESTHVDLGDGLWHNHRRDAGAISENIAAERGDGLWHNHRGDGGASSESMVSDLGDRLWHDHRGDAGAFFESTVADRGDRLWQDHRGDAGASLESTAADRGDRLWQDHRSDAGASPESTGAELGDGIGDGNTRNLSLVQIQPSRYWLIGGARKGKGAMGASMSGVRMLQTVEYNDGRDRVEQNTLSLPLFFFISPLLPKPIISTHGRLDCGSRGRERKRLLCKSPVAQHGWPRCANSREQEEYTKNNTHPSQILLLKLTVPSVMAMCQPPSAVRVLTAIIVGSGAIRSRSSSR